MQLTVFLTYTMTPPPTLLDLSRRNGFFVYLSFLTLDI
jgi:hypothetical protein